MPRQPCERPESKARLSEEPQGRMVPQIPEVPFSNASRRLRLRRSGRW